MMIVKQLPTMRVSASESDENILRLSTFCCSCCSSFVVYFLLFSLFRGVCKHVEKLVSGILNALRRIHQIRRKLLSHYKTTWLKMRHDVIRVDRKQKYCVSERLLGNIANAHHGRIQVVAYLSWTFSSVLRFTFYTKIDKIESCVS